MSISMYIYQCIYVYMYIRICIYVCVFVIACMCMYVCVCVCVCVYDTNTHTHTHTHTHTQPYRDLCAWHTTCCVQGWVLWELLLISMCVVGIVYVCCAYFYSAFLIELYLFLSCFFFPLLCLLFFCVFFNPGFCPVFFFCGVLSCDAAADQGKHFVWKR